MIALVLAAALALPPDLRAYVARRDACEHFAGEDAYDAARGRFLRAQITKFRCQALQTDRRRLLRTHTSASARKALRALSY